MMTKVEQIIEKEKQEAIDKAVEKNTEKVTKSVTEQIAQNFLNAGSSAEFVAENTGLSLDHVKSLAASK